MVRFQAILVACAAAEDALSLLQLNARAASSGVVRVSLDRATSEPSFGNENCPCIGIDNLNGTTEVTAGTYPADLGARCEAWDADRHEDCKGDEPADWCADQWCYVDPCKCDIEVIPKTSAYLPDAEYQGHPVYYSYATCGSEDKWTSGNHEEACVNAENEDACKALDKCAWNADQQKCGGKEAMGACAEPGDLDETKWGKEECRCVGIVGQEGNTSMMISSDPETYQEYPADTGSTCDSWDLENHPDCEGDDKPEWCEARWCYVDPCSCDLGEEFPPKGAFYLPDSTFQGKPLFYSYKTCGATDSFASQEVLDEALAKQQEVCGSD